MSSASEPDLISRHAIDADFLNITSPQKLGEVHFMPGTNIEPFVPRHFNHRRRLSVIDEKNEPNQKRLGWLAGLLLISVSWILVVLSMPFSLFFCLKIVKEYERAVIFRLGKLCTGARGPGIFFVLPCVDKIRIVDLRVISFDVPPQEILSRDSVTVTMDAVVYFHICDPVTSVTKVNDAALSTKLLAQTSLRNILGTKTLAEMLAQRDAIANLLETLLATNQTRPICGSEVDSFNQSGSYSIRSLSDSSKLFICDFRGADWLISNWTPSAEQSVQLVILLDENCSLDLGTEPWGVKVDRVEVKDMRLPNELVYAMAAEAEAARRADARVIAAQGEKLASGALLEASDMLCQSPGSIRLRHLQTLVGIAREQESTILFPIASPFIKYVIDSRRAMMKQQKQAKEELNVGVKKAV